MTAIPAEAHRLTANEEAGLVQYLKFSQELGLPASPTNFKKAAESILASRSGTIVDLREWLVEFLSRFPHLTPTDEREDEEEVHRLVKIVPQSHDIHLLGLHTRYSNWTARVVTVLEYFEIPYSATFINVHSKEGQKLVKKISPAGLVPLLTTHLPGIKITDSLSILLYLSEAYPALPLWPSSPSLRALARSAVAEMHSGFGDLRNLYGTNFVARYTGVIPRTKGANKDVERMLGLWEECRRATARVCEREGKADEGWLFGDFGIADAYFWPVLWRFRSYDLPMTKASPEALEWMCKMWSEPVLRAQNREYFRQLRIPETKIEKYDDNFNGNPEVQYGVFEEDWVFPH